MSRGGSRPGAGRKPKNMEVAALHGSRQRSVVKFPASGGSIMPPAVVPPDPVAMPADLPSKAALIWGELAPLALAAGTLTEGTATAFGMLCRGVVLERKLAKGRSAGGTNHRGMLQWLAARFKDFAIAPFGKPIVRPKPAEDAFGEFDRATG